MLGTILLSPAKGLWWILKELHAAVEAEQEAEGDRLTQQLTMLHMRLEMGEITEQEFDEAEAAILDRLDELKGIEAEGPDDEQDDEQDDEEDDDEQADDEESDEEDE